MEHMIVEKLRNMFQRHETNLHEEIVKFAASFTGSEYGISPSTAISIILGCVCLYMFVKRHWESKQKIKVLERSKSLSEIYGGELAWRRLIDYKVAVAVPDTLDRNDIVLKGLLEEEHLDLKKLQSTVAKLEMVGKEGEAVKILREAKKRHADKPHQAYEIDMLLVEMLIYKAVICGMLGNWKVAEYYWKEFVNVREFIKARDGLLQDENLQRIIDFESFKNRVEVLRSEILNKSRI